MGGTLIVIGIAVLVVATIALIRGRLDWAHIRSRRIAGAIVVVALIVLGVGGELAPPARNAVAAPASLVASAVTASATPTMPTSSSSSPASSSGTPPAVSRAAMPAGSTTASTPTKMTSAQQVASLATASKAAAAKAASAAVAAHQSAVKKSQAAESSQASSASASRAAASSASASQSSAAAADLCGAPSNPYGYNYCGSGSTIVSPRADICSFFNCIANFDNGTGYMEECRDGMVSMSGGRRGACSSHGGELVAVTD